MKAISAEQLKEMFRSMLLIRNVGLKIEELYHFDEMKTPVHLSLGQEAVSVGVCSQLTRQDKIFSRLGTNPCASSTVRMVLTGSENNALSMVI